MMHAIRKIAREVHRRSVWQVVIVYLAMSWVGVEAVDVATDRAGLPEWTPAMAFVLLALGFPVVAATALLQGGLPWLRIEDWADPNELEGLTPEQVHVIPHLHPLYKAGLFTWRNAVLGGVMALALLVTSVVAYLTMWALGIGPVGSLLAQGLVEEGDRVYVADFTNRTDRTSLGPSLAEALRLDMAQSDLFRIVDPDTVEAGADEEGLAVLVEGEVARVGDGYRVTVEVLLRQAPSPVSRFRETVTAEGELIGAIDILSERVRAKLGESLKAIRAGTPLTQLYGYSPGAP